MCSALRRGTEKGKNPAGRVRSDFFNPRRGLHSPSGFFIDPWPSLQSAKGFQSILYRTATVTAREYGIALYLSAEKTRSIL